MLCANVSCLSYGHRKASRQEKRYVVTFYVYMYVGMYVSSQVQTVFLYISATPSVWSTVSWERGRAQHSRTRLLGQAWLPPSGNAPFPSLPLLLLLILHYAPRPTERRPEKNRFCCVPAACRGAPACTVLPDRLQVTMTTFTCLAEACSCPRLKGARAKAEQL